MKLSAVIITKNEGLNIERCLKSLDGIADEIIVVDSFSTDDTKAICLKYNCSFFEREFIDYSIAKNYGNDQTTGDWILSMDADEELSETLRASILKIKSSPEDVTYLFNRLTNYCGSWIKHCGWYPDAKTRLWKKGAAKWEGSIHEKLISATPIKSIKGDILHYSYPNLTFHLLKINHFTDFMAKEMFEKGKKGSLLKMIVSPPFKFIKKYIFQLGFLDGYAGFVVSTMAAYYVFVKYAKLRNLIKNN
jgi:glycosyltransferase involved in cell wall biosynthesis